MKTRSATAQRIAGGGTSRLLTLCVVWLLGGASDVSAQPAGQATSAAQQPASAADGTSRRIQLPFFPNHIAIDPAGDRVFVLRRQSDPATRATMAEAAAIDLATARVLARRDIPAAVDRLQAGRRFVVAFDSSSQIAHVLDALTLELLAQRKLAGDKPPLSIIADQLIVGAGGERYDLPNLEPTSNEFQFVPESGAQGAPTSPRAVAGGWEMGAFVFDDALQRPLWFLGNPHIIGHAAPLGQTGDAAPPAAGTLAFMNVLATVRATGARRWDDEIAVPASYTFADIVSATPPRNPGWVRWQLVTPAAGTGRNSNDTVERLLAHVRADLPDDLDMRQARDAVRVLPAGRRCVAQLGLYLFVFELDEQRYRTLPVVPHVLLDDAPVVVPADVPTTWRIRLSSGVDVQRIEVRAGPLSFDAGDQTVRIDPSEWTGSQDTAALLQSLQSNRRFAPTLGWDDFLAQQRQLAGVTLGRLEHLANRPFQGIPLSIPVDFRAVGSDGSSADLGGCVVIDFVSGQLRDQFTRWQAERLARLELPAAAPADHLVVRFPEAVPGAAAPTLPPIPLVPNAAQLLTWLVANVVLSTSVGALLYRLSVVVLNLFRSARIAVPTLSQAFAGFFVLSLIAESIDVALLPLFERFSERDRAPLIIALAGLSIIARILIMFCGFCFVLQYTLARSCLLTLVHVGLTFVLLTVLAIIVVVAVLALQMGGVI
jgi:hypothetical protein